MSPLDLPHKLQRSSQAPLRVMVVDDSAVLRAIISRMINDDLGACEVVATAAHGQFAVDRVRRGDIDVVVLDIEMPVMDGLTALPKMLAHDPNLVVIMASTITLRNAEVSFKALAAGAKDYVPKPTALAGGASADEFKRELLAKIKSLGERYRRKDPVAKASITKSLKPLSTSGDNGAIVTRPSARVRPAVLAIGSSTGGPTALMTLFKDLPRPLSLPVFITQHMPPTFTTILAHNLARDTGHVCVEAQDGEVVVSGRVYVAPGSSHLTVVRQGASTLIKLNDGPPENFCKPAVDPMLRSLIQVYPGSVLVGILTGMGQDGLNGATDVVRNGGTIVAQDEASSVVWGMPGAVAKAGLCAAVVPLNQMAAQLSSLMGARK